MVKNKVFIAVLILRTQYGLYQEAVGMCAQKNADEEKWRKAVYWVFDAPDMEDKPYIVRK